MQAELRTVDLCCQGTLFPDQPDRPVRQVAQQVLEDFRAFRVPLDQVVLLDQMVLQVQSLDQLVRKVM
jgi:hypothetical protein